MLNMCLIIRMAIKCQVGTLGKSSLRPLIFSVTPLSTGSVTPSDPSKQMVFHFNFSASAALLSSLPLLPPSSLYTHKNPKVQLDPSFSLPELFPLTRRKVLNTVYHWCALYMCCCRFKTNHYYTLSRKCLETTKCLHFCICTYYKKCYIYIFFFLLHIQLQTDSVPPASCL